MANVGSAQPRLNGQNKNATPTVKNISKKVAENLPRTGVEYPVMKLHTKFISEHPECEPLLEQ